MSLITFVMDSSLCSRERALWGKTDLVTKSIASSEQVAPAFVGGLFLSSEFSYMSVIFGDFGGVSLNGQKVNINL